MKKRWIAVITTPLVLSAIFLLFLSLPLLLDRSSHRYSECDTRFLITLSNTSLFDEEKIKNTLQERFSADDLYQSHRDKQWWDHVTFSKPDEDNVVYVSFPEVIQRGDLENNMIKETLQNFDYVSIVSDSIAACA